MTRRVTVPCGPRYICWFQDDCGGCLSLACSLPLSLAPSFSLWLCDFRASNNIKQLSLFENNSHPTIWPPQPPPLHYTPLAPSSPSRPMKGAPLAKGIEIETESPIATGGEQESELGLKGIPKVCSMIPVNRSVSKDNKFLQMAMT